VKFRGIDAHRSDLAVRLKRAPEAAAPLHPWTRADVANAIHSPSGETDGWRHFPASTIDEDWTAFKVKCWLIKGGHNFLDIREIIRELESERDRITQAITALQAVRRPKPVNGRKSVSAANKRGGPRHLSAAARKRISAAAKKRWAKAKAAGKNSL
jgi:hypothetical protein